METFSKVYVGGDGYRCQGGLREGATLQRIGIQDRGDNPRSVAPVEAVLPGVGLGFSPH